MAETLAPVVAAMSDERSASERSLMTRALEVAWDAAIVLAFCTGLFWIFIEAKAVWS